MNRTIKFRAWDKKQNTMLYQGVDFTHIADSVIEDRLTGKVWNFDPKTITGNEVVLLEFTGLLDKNGKEIYEGDIVRGVYQFSGEKKKHETTVEVRFRAPESGMAGFSVWPINFDEFPVEVIGNIYENPELLPKLK